MKSFNSNHAHHGRLVKEVASYKQEAEQTKATADKMAAEGQDEYEVKQAVRRRLYLPIPVFTHGTDRTCGVNPAEDPRR